MISLRAYIIGTGSYLPETVLTNDDFVKFLDTSDEWIKSRTGISTRHIAAAMPAWEMGAHAARSALESANLDPLDIGLIIACTSSPDYLFPSMSCIIQGQLGAKKSFCFDLSAACTGFIYALDTADQFIKTGRVKNVLVVCADNITKLTDYTDRSSCILFGDGAGAAVLSGSETKGIIATYGISDGDCGNLLFCRGVPMTDGLGNRSRELFDTEDSRNLFMNGNKVFQFAVNAMSDAIDRTLDIAGMSASDISYIIPHQANARIINSVIKRRNFDPHQVINRLDKYANTSSATIPICLDDCRREGLIKSNDKILLVGFGAGMTCGATIIDW